MKIYFTSANEYYITFDGELSYVDNIINFVYSAYDAYPYMVEGKKEDEIKDMEDGYYLNKELDGSYTLYYKYKKEMQGIRSYIYRSYEDSIIYYGVFHKLE